MENRISLFRPFVLLVRAGHVAGGLCLRPPAVVTAVPAGLVKETGMAGMFRIFSIQLLCLVFLAGGAEAGFLIELRNGGEILVSDYWEVDGEIRYSRYGGFVGIPLDSVKDINPTERPVKVSGDPSRAAGIDPAPRPAEAGLETRTVTETGEEPGPAEHIDATPEELRYMPEFENLKRRFGNLSAMNQQDMIEFSEDLTAFRNKVLSEGLGHIYNVQLLELYDMGDTLADEYRTRFQRP